MFHEIHKYGAEYRRLKSSLLFGLPYGNALPDQSDTDLEPGCLFFLTTDEGIYKHNGTLWTLVAGGGSGVVIGDGLISGGQVTWVSGLIFDVQAAVYRINGVTYNSPATQITLPASDPTNPRYDLILLNTSSVVDTIQGTPAVSPLQPTSDPATELGLAYVHIAAAATVPTGISNITIYNENTEWTGTGDYTGLNFNYATNPFSGSKSTFVTSGTGVKFIKYANASTVNASDYTTLKFYIRLGASVANGTNITVYLYNGNAAVSSGVNLGTSHGLVKTTINTWQVITVPLSNFTFSNNAFDGLMFRTTQTIGQFQLDNILLQNGVSTVPGNGVNSFNSRTGNVIPLPGDYPPAFIGAEAVANKGVVGGYASLDGSGKVPSSQLPSYVDDVLEFANLAAFPVTGTASIIYIALDTNNTYRWTGATYVQVGGSSVAAASETVAGVLEIATQAEVTTGTDDTRAVSPLKLETRLSTLPGGAVKATASELNTGTDDAKFATALALEDSKYVNQNDSKNYTVASGTDTYVATLTPAITAYTAGQRLNIKFTNANTGAATLNLNGLGATAIKKDGAGTALAAADITAGRVVSLVYDGTNFQTIGAAAAGGGGGGTWGSITGTLSSQTDLQTALDAKADNVLSAGYAAAAGTVAIGDALEVAVEKLAGNAAATDIFINQQIASIAGNYSQSII